MKLNLPADWQARAHFYRWARTGWRRHLPNQPKFPVTVWALARKPG